MYKLDERDIQILSILQEEGRITKTALAVDYQDFVKRVLKADIGMRRYFSYAVLDCIKDTNAVPVSLIKKSELAKK